MLLSILTLFTVWFVPFLPLWVQITKKLNEDNSNLELFGEYKNYKTDEGWFKALHEVEELEKELKEYKEMKKQ